MRDGDGCRHETQRQIQAKRQAQRETDNTNKGAETDTETATRQTYNTNKDAKTDTGQTQRQAQRARGRVRCLS